MILTLAWKEYREQVAEADVVLGPCEDGGYYLINPSYPEARISISVVL